MQLSVFNLFAAIYPGMETKAVLKERETTDIMITELADAHCHLDLIQDPSVISEP